MIARTTMIALAVAACACVLAPQAHAGTLNACAAGFNADGSEAYACGDDGLAVRTADGGTTWTYVNVPWSDDLHDVASTFRSSNGQSRTMVAVGDGGTIWRLPLGGTEWTRPTSVKDIYGDPWPPANLRALSFCPNGNGGADLGWAVGELGTILHTTDRGENWVQQICPVGDDLLAVDVRASNLALATTAQGRVLKWNGTSWTTLTTDLPAGTVLCDVDFATRTTGDWSQTAYGCDRCGAVWKTTNQGVTWMQKRSPLVSAASAGDTAGLAVGQTSADIDTVTVVAGNVSTHRGAHSTSTDGGATWSLSDGAVETRDAVTCAVPQGSVMYAVGGIWDGGASRYRAAIIKSVNRVNWTRVWEKDGWDRELAKDYAQTWTSNTDEEMRNPAWPDLTHQGGDCTNYVSQSLEAGGILMDGTYGTPDWACGHLDGETWLMGHPWAGAVDFWDYWRGSSGRYLIGTYDWKSGTSRPQPPKVPSGARRGDVVSYVMHDVNGGSGFDGSTWTDISHTAIITGINAWSTEHSLLDFKGDLTCQHTADRYRVAWTLEDRLTTSKLIKTGYVIWGLADSTDSGLNP